MGGSYVKSRARPGFLREIGFLFFLPKPFFQGDFSGV